MRGAETDGLHSGLVATRNSTVPGHEDGEPALAKFGHVEVQDARNVELDTLDPRGRWVDLAALLQLIWAIDHAGRGLPESRRHSHHGFVRFDQDLRLCGTPKTT